MKKWIKVMFMLTMMAIVAVFVYGKYALSSITGNSDPDEVIKEYEKISVRFSKETLECFYDRIIFDAEDLEKKSACIVSVEVLPERCMKLRSTETKIKIKEIWKDESKSLKEDQEVFLIEPVSINRNNTYATTGYQFVKTGETYLMFLNPLPCVEGYQYTEKEKISLIPSTVCFSRYCISREEITGVYADGMDYHEISEWPLVTKSEKRVKKYERLRKKIMGSENGYGYPSGK